LANLRFCPFCSAPGPESEDHFARFQMNAIDRGVRDPDLDSTSDLDEPMGSQSVDVEAPLTHNSSKSNFFASPESEQPTPDQLQQQLISNSKTAANRGSFKTHVRGTESLHQVFL
jgi:hypothetical protein